MRQPHSLTTTIEIRDKDGRKIGDKEVATYQGLLAKAHDEGLRRIATRLIQIPQKENEHVAIVLATVKTNRGTFTGIGDASPGNVKRTIVAHIVRMAETRAKARALRDAVNIGIVALEELGELIEDEPMGDRREASSPKLAANDVTPDGARRSGGSRQNEPMSDAQRRLLLRIVASRGVSAEGARSWLAHELGIATLDSLTVAEASRAITELQQETTNGTSATANGHTNGAPNEGVDR